MINFKPVHQVETRCFLWVAASYSILQKEKGICWYAVRYSFLQYRYVSTLETFWKPALLSLTMTASFEIQPFRERHTELLCIYCMLLNLITDFPSDFLQFTKPTSCPYFSLMKNADPIPFSSSHEKYKTKNQPTTNNKKYNYISICKD